MLNFFIDDLSKADYIIGHNISFDNSIVGCEFLRNNIANLLIDKISIDTKNESTNFCQLPGGRGGKYKWPNLSELYQKLFNDSFSEAHNASADVEATTRCFLELIRIKVISYKNIGMELSDFQEFEINNPSTIQLIGLNIQAYKNTEDNKDNNETIKEIDGVVKDNNEIDTNYTESKFSHLHVHSQYSVLQAMGDVNSLVNKAAEMKMPAIGLTDHANMFGSYKFVDAVLKHPINSTILKDEKLKLKPILGCELNVCINHLDKSVKDYGSQIPFLAKNKIGYHNLSKLSSLGYVEGFYYIPRVDKDLILKYKKGLIVLSGSLYGSISNLILNIGESQAEDEFKWWYDNFGDDFYVEINRHGLEDEDHVNKILIALAKKYDVKILASNNVYYINKEESYSHDILLCVKDGEQQSTPIGKGRGFRHGFLNDEFYFKSSQEMHDLFSDIPDAIENIEGLIDKIDIYKLSTDVLLPAFDIPNEFHDKKDENDDGKRGENKYLKYLTYEGAKERYIEISDEIKERIDFELKTIEKSGYPGYFLIVQDFIAQARRMNVSVGPGRGSAAGSVVAYCTKITNIDPIKYDLLFERFLNPERISLPDIDIDFDDEGRSRVIDWVVDKYGKNNVAQIITYGTMAAKSSIRDTARVLNLPLYEADKTAKLVPDLMSLSKIFNYSDKELKKNVKKDQLANAKKLIDLSKGDDLVAKTINNAIKLEGSIRNIGTHACGIIITPEPLIDLIPITNSKDAELMVTQFDNSVVEDAGLLKMDFLGLRNLTIIKDCIKIIKHIHQITLDIDTISLEDKETYEIFKNGRTKGIFQFSSDGMRAHLKQLKPDKFDDLIAMNALYRPGPMEYIPSFINRKHGTEDIEYDLPAMEEYLAETYGITVYQEQVMLLSQKLADFTKGEADVLRKAMGKKQIAVLDKMKPKFIEQASAKGHDSEKLEKIWKDWEAFASYAFNKSHSTCYAWIAYQTAYLKAHYPAEYMASVLSNNMNDIKSVSFFMEECKRMGLPVFGPDLNESFLKFSVNNEGAVRFGMAAVKGVGAGAVRAIIKEREENGNYASIFDLAKRVDLRAANKKSFDSLIKAGAFDSFTDTHRAQYFHTDEKGLTFLERAMKYGSKYQENENSAQVSMFGEASTVQFPEPDIPECETWGTMELLSQEKEVIGIYISAHPLDDFKNEMIFCNASLKHFKDDLSKYINMNLSFAGIISDVQHRVSKAGKGWALFTIEDYSDSNEFRIFGEEYLRMKHFLVPNSFLFVRATIQAGWTNKEGVTGEPRLKFTEMKLLHDIMDELCKKITIKIQLQEIKENTILNLETILKNNPGKQSLNFTVWDAKEKIEVSLPSRNTKIKVSNELLATLESQQINFKLN